MAKRTLKFKHNNNTDKYVDDIKFCGGIIEEKVISLPNKSVYFTISEPEDNSFSRKFRETRSSKFLLN